MIKRYNEWRLILEQDEDLNGEEYNDEEFNSTLDFLFGSNAPKREDWEQAIRDRFSWEFQGERQELDMDEYETTNGFGWRWGWSTNIVGLTDIEFSVDFIENGEDVKIDQIFFEAEHRSPHFEVDSNVPDDDYDDVIDAAENENHTVEYAAEWRGEMPKTPKELIELLTRVQPRPEISLPSGDTDWGLPEGWRN